MLYHHSPFCKSIPKTLHSILWSGLGTLLLQKYILWLIQWSSRWSTKCKRRSKLLMLLQIQKELHKSWADMLDQVLWRRTWWNIRNTNTCTCKKGSVIAKDILTLALAGYINGIHKICYKYHSISTTHSQKSKSKRIQRQTVNKAIVITSTSTDITSNAHRFRLYPFSSL